MKCGNCDGKGVVDLHPEGGFPSNPGKRPIQPIGTRECPVCRGIGDVPGPSEEVSKMENKEQA